MLSAVAKEYFRDPANGQGKKTVMVSFMPCTAKKMEAKRPNSRTEGEQDTDFVITTTELVQMIKTTGIDFADLESEASDVPFGLGSGGGVIFGVTGGVTEAVIRRVLADASPNTMQTIAECGVRGLEGTKIFEVTAGKTTLRIGVVSGLKNTDQLIEKIKSGAVELDFVEVMACPNGCIGGGGQPCGTNRTKAKRSAGLFQADSECDLKLPQDNPALDYVYNTLLQGRAHELLHVKYV